MTISVPLVIISAKSGINYPYLEPGNEFQNQVAVVPVPATNPYHLCCILCSL